MYVYDEANNLAKAIQERKIMNKKDIKKGLMPYIFLLVFFIGCLLIFNIFNNVVNELTYDEFLQDLNGGKITELTITPKVRTETYKLFRSWYV